jgi:hypothetical protein
VTLDSIPQNGNWLTFGIAKKGMKSSYSDGFGRTADTWGIAQDSSVSLPVVTASAVKLTSLARKLRERDVLSAEADVAEGWCEVRLNQSEFVHRFSIPRGTKDAYQFGVSLATDHQVSVLRTSVSASAARATSAPTARTATGPVQFSKGEISPPTPCFRSFPAHLHTLLTLVNFVRIFCDIQCGIRIFPMQT